MCITTLLLLLLISPARSLTCSSDQVKFHESTGVDCVRSDFVRLVSGLCTAPECGVLCAHSNRCKAFRLMPDGVCQCKLFLFDACSHRVQSEPNCTNNVTVYVRALPGVPPGRLCPPGYQHTRYGTSYKVVAAQKLNWTNANVTCSRDAGLTKFADTIDLDEADYVRNLSLSADSSIEYYIGGHLETSISAVPSLSWVWSACHLPISNSVWHSGEPNGAGAPVSCINYYKDYMSGGINDEECSGGRGYICECQTVF